MFSLLLGKYPGLRLPHIWYNHIYLCKILVCYFIKVAALFCIPINNIQEVHLLHILLKTRHYYTF